MAEFVSMSDISRRWTAYTPRGSRKLAASPSFPSPAFAVSGGNVKVWRLVDILEFEKTHPEVKSEQAKRHKVIGYRYAKAKGRQVN